MRIRYAIATGCPYGQFVVTAENDQERAILQCFLSAPREQWEFRQHGVSYMSGLDGPTDFNFGWVNKADAARWSRDFKRQRSWFGRLRAALRRGECR